MDPGPSKRSSAKAAAFATNAARQTLRFKTWVWILAVMVALTFVALPAWAQDRDPLLEILIRKGVLTPTEADQVQKEAKDLEKEKQKKAETKTEKQVENKVATSEQKVTTQVEQKLAAKPQTNPYTPGKGRTVFSDSDVNLTIGGFIELAGIYRNRFEGSDVGSKFNLGAGGVPLPNSPNYYMDELRGSARQSRLTLLAQGKDDYAALAAYFELDFQGGANSSSANSIESNSYYPRIRQLYATYDDTIAGWYLLFGQTWSTLTMFKEGIVPRQENVPLTIDAQYVPGFTWTRNPQIRLVKTLDDNMVSLGLSVESPQAIITAGGLSPGAQNYNVSLVNPGNYAYYNTTSANSNLPSNLSLDEYPDIVAKVAVDPGFGHYELYGLGRFFTDRTVIYGNRSNNTTFAPSGGGAGPLPVVPKLLDFQGSVLAGSGIGRYGSAQFSDAVVNPVTGKLDPIPEVEALAGLIAHPTDRLDVWGYAGLENVWKKDVFGKTGGFGNPHYANPLDEQEGFTGSTSNVEATAVEQLTFGAWYSFYKGRYGLMRVGVSEAWNHLLIFSLHSENISISMLSLRYYF